MQLYNYRKKRKRRFYNTSSHTHRHHRYRRRYRASVRKRIVRGILATSAVCLVLVLAAFGTFAALRMSGKNELMKYAGTEQMNVGSKQSDSGLVSKNGKKYKYNEDVITLLCMGIDKNSENWQSENEYGSNGQADAVFLLVLNQQAHSMKLIGISRDTMTEIKTYDAQGNYIGESVNHLALAFSYGKTKQEGAEFVKEAVSKLFYNLPIHGYAAIDWDALGKINDSVGGVPVTLSEDMILSGEQHFSGETLRLTGEQAKSYVRHRGDEQGSNNERMQRQKVYANAFVTEAKTAIKNNPLLIKELYDELTADMATSIGVNEAVYLGTLLPEVSFSMEDIAAVEGKVKQGTIYEEFYADEEKLQNLILETFYDEVG